ncbi:MAG: 16S rRNA (cytosine(1402)-N(4))-methyltransferase [Chthoniobacter sp.]
MNRELEALSSGLEAFAQRLAPGGRLAILTFHSLEDRIVKVFFKERTTAFIDRPEWPEARPNPLHIFKAITGKPVVASDAEQRANPRSRSAKLRVVERITHVQR